MVFVKSYKDLEVYKLSRILAKDVFLVSLHFPKEEKYSLTDQIRKASRSIGAQIAEAWGKRKYPKSFVSKLTDADGEQFETEHWTETAHDCGYLSKEKAEEWNHHCLSLNRMLNSMMLKADTFCKMQ